MVTPDLRLHDIRTFLVVCRCGTVSGAARELAVTPSQVSKALRRLEEQLSCTLLVRATHGVALSDDGRRLFEPLRTLVQTAEQLTPGVAKQNRALTFAAPSFVLDTFAPTLLTGGLGCRLRFLELPPMLVRLYAASNAFDAAITLGESVIGPGWDCVELGTASYVLFGSTALVDRLGPGPHAESVVRELPFVSPIFLADGQFLPVGDDCPLTRAHRVVGEETTRLGLALSLVARSEQLVYGPRFAGIQFLRRGELKTLVVEGWDGRVPVNLWCNVDRVMSPERRKVADLLRLALLRSESE